MSEYDPMSCENEGYVLTEAVFQLLFDYEGEITEKQICQSLGVRKYNEFEAVRHILEEDKRFIQCASRNWKCAPLNELCEDRPLKEVEFLITDIESTGSIKGKDRIIEIAAAKVKNGEIIDQFESLVDPEKSISHTIARLTHISNKTIVGAPVIEVLMPEFIEFARDTVFVAHNSKFDFHFINYEIKRLGLESALFGIDICTVRLAKRLLPDCKAHGVTGLSKYFDYEMTGRHRAMPDVLATKYYFDQFLEMLDAENVTTLYQLIQFQKERLNKKKLRKKINRKKKHERYKS